MTRYLCVIVGCLASLCIVGSLFAEKVEWKKDDGGNGHSYEVVSVSDGVAWTAAQEAAEEQGGHLATIQSKEENEFVFKLADDEKLWRDDGYNNYGPWLGGFQEKEAKETGEGWSWITKEEWDYDNWIDGEPNDGDSTEDRQEDYAHFFTLGSLERQGEWNDSPGLSANIVAYVIEWTPEGEAVAEKKDGGDSEKEGESQDGE